MDVAQKENNTEYLFDELNDLKVKIDSCKDLPEDLKSKALGILDRVNRMAKLGNYSSEFENLAKYVDVITKIPWNTYTEDKLDIKYAEEILEKNHYGIKDVKERIIEYLSTMILLKKRGITDQGKSPVILFVGLQGIGKTTISISIADALQRKFVRIPMGGLGSVQELRGVSRTNTDAEPGQIIKALINSGVRNPVILLDEIDKTSGSESLRFDFMAVLLEILDPNQNHSFRDQYVDYPFDLSDVVFVCSANYTNTIAAALMDRLEVIKMPSYTDIEKVEIGKKYLFPKILKTYGLTPEELVIEDSLWINVVRPFGFDAGIRSLQRTLEGVTRKVAREIVEGKVTSVKLTEQNLKQYLPKY